AAHSGVSTETSTPALLSIRVPNILEFLPFLRDELGLPQEDTPRDAASSGSQQAVVAIDTPQEDGPRLRKRRRRRKPDPEQIVPPEADEVWAKLPQYLRYLAEWTDDSVTRRYYPARIRESREELIARLTDPVLSLEEVARLLGVCPATVRRYTDRGWLKHFRTEGNQRRFRLSDVVAFLEEQALRRPLGNRNAHQSASEEADETP
ncbi:MAG: helix-turn-helix domain-containing protein, partial [Fimbriimonadales bacterium]